MPKATPKNMKNKSRFADKEVSRLIINAIIHNRGINGTTHKFIMNYVNAHTTKPYISQKTINYNIISNIDNGKIIKSGAYYKLKKKKINPLQPYNPIKKIYPTHNINIQNIIIIGIIIMFGFFAVAKARNDDDDDDDDDEMFAEVLFDIMIGVFIEACNQNDMCRTISNMVAISLIIITLVVWCATGACICKSPSRRDIRRGATIYGGMRMHDYLRN